MSVQWLCELLMPLICENCSGESLVRTKKYQVRCLSCLHRFQVESGLWKQLPESRRCHDGHTIWDSIALFNCDGVPFWSLRGLATILLIVVFPAVISWFSDRFMSLHWSLIVFLAVGWLTLVLVLFGWLQDIGKPHKNVPTHCDGCGYDLHGLGRCPECGKMLRCKVLKSASEAVEGDSNVDR